MQLLNASCVIAWLAFTSPPVLPNTREGFKNISAQGKLSLGISRLQPAAQQQWWSVASSPCPIHLRGTAKLTLVLLGTARPAPLAPQPAKGHPKILQLFGPCGAKLPRYSMNCD